MPLTPEEMEELFARYSGINRMIGARGNYLVQPLDEYDYLEQMESVMNRAERIRSKAMRQALRNSQIRLRNQMQLPPRILFPDLPKKVDVIRTRQGRPIRGPVVKGGGRFPAFVKAIVGQESGGDINAVSSAGALGKYQIMPGNIFGPGGWDVETIGRNVGRRQFLNRERLQDRIAIGKLREYFRLYGPRGAAAAWYSGDPGRKNDFSHVSSGPSVGEYVQEVMGRTRRINRRMKRRGKLPARQVIPRQRSLKHQREHDARQRANRRPRGGF